MNVEIDPLTQVSDNSKAENQDNGQRTDQTTPRSFQKHSLNNESTDHKRSISFHDFNLKANNKFKQLARDDPQSIYKKRHSISALFDLYQGGDGSRYPRLTDAYNETQIPETTTKSVRRYLLEPKTVANPSSSSVSGTKHARKRSIAIMKVHAKNLTRMDSSVKKINHFVSPEKINSFIGKAPDTSRSTLRQPKEETVSLDDSSSDSEPEDTTNVENSDSDYEDFDIDSPLMLSTASIQQTVQEPVLSKVSNDVTLRTLERQQIMKDMLERKAKRSTSDLHESQNPWPRAAIDVRNRYAQISTNLRTLAIFGKRPAIESIERVRHKNIKIIDSDTLLEARNKGRDLCAKLWDKSKTTRHLQL